MILSVGVKDKDADTIVDYYRSPWDMSKWKQPVQ